MPNQLLSTVLLTTDQSFSVLRSDSSTLSLSIAYSAFGFHALDGATLASRFNGQVLERIAQGYLLGNGYRSYNPALQRFTCPDSMSPFGEGGLNGYVYCDSDPVNRIDPSGHVPYLGKLFRWLSKKLRPRSRGKVSVTKTSNVVQSTASTSAIQHGGAAGKSRVGKRNIYKEGGFMTLAEAESWHNYTLPQVIDPKGNLSFPLPTYSGFTAPSDTKIFRSLNSNVPPGVARTGSSSWTGQKNLPNVAPGAPVPTRVREVRGTASENLPWRSIRR